MIRLIRSVRVDLPVERSTRRMLASHILNVVRRAPAAASSWHGHGLLESFSHQCHLIPIPAHQIEMRTNLLVHHSCHPYRFRAASTLSAGLPHDIGGDTSAYGPLTALRVDRADELQDWEVRCHSLFAVLAVKKVVSTDGLRRAIEALTPRQYASWTYYEKWAAGMTTLLLEKGVVSSKELDDALFGKGKELNSSNEGKPTYNRGDFVKVRSYRQDGSGIEWRRPHIRVPGYAYGVRGVIERVCDVHDDPSFLAFGLNAPKVRLYRVRFKMRDIWPEHTDKDGDDVIEAEVYEPWLEPSDSPTGHEFANQLLFDHTSGEDCIQHAHLDDHAHDHNHHEHSHDPRPLVEERAANLESEPRPGKELYEALIRVLIEKDVVSFEEIRVMSEHLVMAGKNLNGASLVVKAWTDAAFEERLLSDAAAAASEIGIITSNPNAPTVLTVVKNTSDVHNVVVCTLCSCYPSGLLGIAPSWYRSREYRSRAVREPRRVLQEFGTDVPDTKQIRVHDSTADHRYLVLPERPKGTEGWTDEELSALVTRDSLVGVAVPSA